MIVVIDAQNRVRFSGLLDEMLLLRGRDDACLGTSKQPCHLGRDLDVFDELDATYILSMDQDRHVRGALRILPTMGPHLLSDVYFEHLNGVPPAHDPAIYEVSRLCLDPTLSRNGAGAGSQCQVATELMLGLVEHALSNDITSLVTIGGPRLRCFLERLGMAPQLRLSPPWGKATSDIEVGFVDCSEAGLQLMRSVGGINTPVIMDHEALEQIDAPAEVEILTKDLQAYCREQIVTATSQRDQTAAMALQEALINLVRSQQSIEA